MSQIKCSRVKLQRIFLLGKKFLIVVISSMECRQEEMESKKCSGSSAIDGQLIKGSDESLEISLGPQGMGQIFLTTGAYRQG